jgi:lycopene elongase/hydratase (dihydrobisanhydrobacterioruberin-forming)
MVSAARQTGYRLLGSRFDYLLHTRPREWPIVAGHAAVGYLLAVTLAGAARGRMIGSAALAIVLWVVCLNGGTLALNSAHDRDEGDVAYLHQPPVPPSHLGAFGIGLMLVGLAGGLVLPPEYRIAYTICLVLSLLYSVPPVRLKAVPGADWLINMIGFGSLTPYAAWAATGLRLTLPGGLVLLAFCPLFAALYPLTQIYQFEEDARRGDRTLARSLGVRRSLLVAMAAALVAFLLLGGAGLAAGWDPRQNWRWIFVGVAGLSWAFVLVPWFRGHARMTARQHQAGMYRALIAWAVTDMAVVVAWCS